MYFDIHLGKSDVTCSLDIPHGHVEGCLGTKCSYVCEEGFEKNDEFPTISCSSQGEWYYTASSGLVVTSDFCKRISKLEYERGHSISYKIVCAPCEDSYQHAHPRSLITFFAVNQKTFWIQDYPKMLYEDSDQTGLIRVFAGRISNLVGNAMLGPIKHYVKRVCTASITKV